MQTERPTRLSNATLAIALIAAVLAAIWRIPDADWEMGLFAILLGFSIFSDVTAIEMESRLKISGSFLAIVLAMVFLGATPAALIGVISIVAGSIRFREKWNDFFFNLLTYITFPVIVGTAFHEIVDATRITPSDPIY